MRENSPENIWPYENYLLSAEVSSSVTSSLVRGFVKMTKPNVIYFRVRREINIFVENTQRRKVIKKKTLDFCLLR